MPTPTLRLKLFFLNGVLAPSEGASESVAAVALAGVADRESPGVATWLAASTSSSSSPKDRPPVFATFLRFLHAAFAPGSLYLGRQYPLPYT